MPPPLELILGLAVPIVVSATILLLGWIVGRARNRPQTWASPVAIAAGLVAGVWVIQGRPPQYEPFQATGSVVWLGLAAAILAGATSFFTLPGGVRWIGVSITGAVTAYFLTKPQLPAYSTPELILLLATSAVVLLAWRLIWERIALESPRETTVRVSAARAAAPLAMTAVAAGVSILLLMSASMFLGRAGGALAASIGPVLIFSFFTDRVPFARGGVFVAALLTLGLLMSGHYYADLIRPHALLILAGPLFLLPMFVGPFSRTKGWKRTLLTVVLVMLPVATALAWATPTFLKTIDESAESAGY